MGPDTTGIRSIENFTSAAVKGEPSWNFTPGRSLNSQVEVSIAFHEVASRGSRDRSSPDQTRVSKTCLSASAWVPVAVKCGSIDSGPERTPMFSVWAKTAVEAVSIRAAAKAAPTVA